MGILVRLVSSVEATELIVHRGIVLVNGLERGATLVLSVASFDVHRHRWRHCVSNKIRLLQLLLRAVIAVVEQLWWLVWVSFECVVRCRIVTCIVTHVFHFKCLSI